ncbi:MAG: cyclase family protein [Acidobacteria bacterium]|nr:cyclase family protein [Acidobacteriota bacterium]
MRVDPGGIFDCTAVRWIDLTHAFSDSTIYWPTDTAGFQLEELAFGPTEGGWFYALYQFATAEHGGTHLDAPIHFAEGRWTNDDIPLSALMGPAVVVDVTARVTPDYLVTVADLTDWEARHGEIPPGAVVLVRTGWSSRWSDRTADLGTGLVGEPAVAQLHFPGPGEEAARWLAEQRDIAAVGIDTPSIDRGQSADFLAHVTLYRENIVGFENLADLSGLPATGSYVMGLPMKITGG